MGQILQFLSFLGILQGGIITLVLMLKRGLSLATYRLITITFLICVIAMFLINLKNYFGIDTSYINYLEGGLMLLAAPLLYLSVCSPSRLTFYKLVHFIPLFLYIVLLVGNFTGILSLRIPVIIFVIYIQLCWLVGLLIFWKRKSSTDKRVVVWQQYFLLFFFLIAVAQWLRIAYKSSPDLKVLVTAFSCLGFYILTIKGLLDIKFFDLKKPTPKKNIENSDNLLNNLKTLMNQEVFTNEDLSLSKLACELNTHPNDLSHIIQHHYQKSFTDYINEYRLNKVLLLLKDAQQEKYTIEALAQEAGFKSRANFYKVFKEKAGCTPSQYRKQIPR